LLQKYLDKDKGWESCLERSVWHVVYSVAAAKGREEDKSVFTFRSTYHMFATHVYLFSISHIPLERVPINSIQIELKNIKIIVN